MKQIIAILYLWYLNVFPINKGKNFIARLLTKFFGSFIVKTKENISIEIFLSSQMDTSYFDLKFNRNNIIIEEINKLETGQSFLDIGANIGYYSLLASKKIGNSGRVYSFEPSSREFRRLLKNIEINNCTNIIPSNIALSDSNNEIYFSIAQGHTGLNSFTIEDESVYKTPQIIKAMKLDNYFNSENRKFQLAKIDVEGAELLVLKGMENILKGLTVQRMIIEITPRFFKSFRYKKEDIYDFLSGYGYTPLINDVSEQYDELFILKSLNY
jgi:FkbM family methyltransferase